MYPWPDSLVLKKRFDRHDCIPQLNPFSRTASDEDASEPDLLNLGSLQTSERVVQNPESGSANRVQLLDAGDEDQLVSEVTRVSDTSILENLWQRRLNAARVADHILTQPRRQFACEFRDQFKAHNHSTLADPEQTQTPRSPWQLSLQSFLLSSHRRLLYSMSCFTFQPYQEEVSAGEPEPSQNQNTAFMEAGPSFSPWRCVTSAER